MSKYKNTFLVTGAAGFIGSELVKRLLKNGESVVGIDNVNDYYDQNLKRTRLSEIKKCLPKYKGKWFFHEISIENIEDLNNISEKYSINIVIHLAAQAGVRNSILNPGDYVRSNLFGFYNILEFCRNNIIENFIFASSSSVYGGNKKVPFREIDNVDHPISFYGATKKANEVMAHSYSHLFNIPSTGLRFFTVYGPWGRPDMALFTFTNKIVNEEPITLFNHGDMIRDFTYVGDIVQGIGIILNHAMKNNVKDIYNIGYGKQVQLMDFVDHIETNLGRKAIRNYVPKHPADTHETWSNTEKLQALGYKPTTPIETGITAFIDWYKSYYGVN